MGGTCPDPLVEVQHAEERLIVLIAGNARPAIRVGVQFEELFCHPSGGVPAHTVFEEAIAVSPQAVDRVYLIIVRWLSHG
jgi:hypothetical protein